LQALLNIGQNALQAMPTGGQLKIECQTNSDSKDGMPMLVIRISDTGPGIPLEHLENIFDPFFTTKDVGHGTGLGLAVSSRIVEEHGGEVEVANHPAGGAVFSVYLPQTKSVESRL
jgi:two-component system sensor histidine kinase HupT/HoxJ